MFVRFLCLFFCFLIKPALATESIELGKITVQELEQIFSFYQYDGEKGYLMIPEYNYPPIFCNYFPSDFNTITDEKKRNTLFIKILAPLTLKLNAEILSERKDIKSLAQSFQTNKQLTPEQIKILEKKASKYDVFTRLRGDYRYQYLLDELLKKVHVVAPSVLITAAALETNWGTSRIVKEGNSLYKTLIWHTSDGLKTIGETEDDSYRIKTYHNIYDSMKEFALKLNSSISFDNFRGIRHEILERRTLLLGSTLAPYLVWNSPLKNYAGLFEYTLSYYELNIIDKSILNSKMISGKKPSFLKEFNYITKN